MKRKDISSVSDLNTVLWTQRCKFFIYIVSMKYIYLILPTDFILLHTSVFTFFRQADDGWDIHIYCITTHLQINDSDISYEWQWYLLYYLHSSSVWDFLPAFYLSLPGLQIFGQNCVWISTLFYFLMKKQFLSSQLFNVQLLDIYGPDVLINFYHRKYLLIWLFC